MPAASGSATACGISCSHAAEDRRPGAGPIQFDRLPSPASPAHDLGADTDAVMAEIGLDEDAVIAAKVAGILL